MSPTKQLTLPITGMTCANCVASVERNIKKVDGVRAANVNLSSERATVEFDPNLAEAHQNLAYSYYMVKKYDLAWKHVGIAKKLHAKVPEELVTAIKQQL